MSLPRHTAYNIAGQVIPLVLSLVTIPIYLDLIGDARFGILALIWLFFSYMSLADLGMGQASARQLARLAIAPEEGRREGKKVLSTAFVISLALGMLGAILAQPLGIWLFSRQSPNDHELGMELLAAIPWAAALVPLTAVAGVANGALQARRAFAEINILGVLASILVLIVPLAIAAVCGPNLEWLVAGVVCVRIVLLPLTLWRACRFYFSELSIEFDSLYAGQLLRFGGWMTVSAVVGPLMVIADRFAIGMQIGSRAVSQYVIPFQMAERSTVFSVALTQALFPSFVKATSETEKLQLSTLGIKRVTVWTTPLFAFALLFAGPFLAWWISPELAANSTSVAQILLISYWINSIAMIPLTKLLADNQPNLVAKCHLIELLPYLILLYAGTNLFGIIGAAAAFALRVAVDFFLLSHMAGTLQISLRFLLVPGLLLAGIATSAHLTNPWGWSVGIALSIAVLAWSTLLTRCKRI